MEEPPSPSRYANIQESDVEEKHDRYPTLAVVLGSCHALVACFGFVFWFVVFGSGVDLSDFIVPAAWFLLAAIFGLPLTVNLVYVVWKMHISKVQSRSEEPTVFFVPASALICTLVAQAGLFSGVAAFGGGAMGHEYLASGAGLVLVATCFSLSAFCLRRVALAPKKRARPKKFFADNRMRDQNASMLGQSPLRTLARYVALALLGLALGTFALINGAAAYRLAERGWVFRHNRPSPSSYVAVRNNGMFFLSCSGQGVGDESDVVVLMDADVGSSSYGWGWLQPALAQQWRVCVFDRPGYGWSTSQPPPRTASRETKDLLRALQAANMSPHTQRFVYVSHGLSSWNALLFAERAQRYRQGSVVAMVFLDPLDPSHRTWTDPEERERFSFALRWGPWGMQLNAFGVLQPFFGLMTYFRPLWNLPDATVGMYVDAISRQSFWTTMVEEIDAFEDSGNETVTLFPPGAQTLGSMPIVVWGRNESTSNDYFLALSSQAASFNLTGSETHFFIFDKIYADSLVQSIIGIVIKAIRGEQ